ncbi:MAG: SUMF1/EgtB/PvdO family nonheme iron enzyme [Kiritimatiellae bacterium]|nr:SUMF1/EgtB/PvdO family nonheme iron enzyme [Kiritimatiellia bacterium]
MRGATGSNRVYRGGSWNNNARNCRSANRNRNQPSNCNNNLGFRLCCSAAPQGMNRAAPAAGPFPETERTKTADWRQ